MLFDGGSTRGSPESFAQRFVAGQGDEVFRHDFTITRFVQESCNAMLDKRTDLSHSTGDDRAARREVLENLEG
jgi:hypothetical protein